MKKDNGSVVRFPEKMGFFGLSSATNVVFNFKSIYYTIFLTNVLHIPIAVAGVMNTVGLIWDFVNDPLVGVWANNIHFKSGEKIRPYLLYIAIPYAAGMVLLFTDFNLNVKMAVALQLIVFFLYEIANTFRGIAYNGLGGLASNNDEDRKAINAYRSLGGCFGSAIGAVAVTPLVKLFGGLQGPNAIIGKEDAPALFKTALFMGFLCLFGCLLQYFTSKERVKEIEVHEDKVSIKDTYVMLFKCKSWIWNMFYIMCYGIVNSLIMTNISYYAAYILGSSSKATPILAVYLVVAITTSILSPKIDRLLGRKRTTIVACLVQIIGKIPFILNPYSLVNVIINAVSMGIGGTLAFVTFNTNRNNISDVVELINHRRLDTMVSMGDTLASKVAEALVGLAMTSAMAMAGFDEALKLNQTDATKATICALLGWIPSIILLVMAYLGSRIDIEKEKEEALAKRAQ
ncbi:MAG: MFS transporter [Mogibacterium sp.]|nr:MFS transporter [Mogibacterium sp.]